MRNNVNPQDEVTTQDSGVSNPDQHYVRNADGSFSPIDTPEPDNAPQSPAETKQPERDLETEFTHWVHLADGQVKKSFGALTHWHETDDPNDPGIPVIGVYCRPQ